MHVQRQPIQCSKDKKEGQQNVGCLKLPLPSVSEAASDHTTSCQQQVAEIPLLDIAMSLIDPACLLQNATTDQQYLGKWLAKQLNVCL